MQLKQLMTSWYHLEKCLYLISCSRSKYTQLCRTTTAIILAYTLVKSIILCLIFIAVLRGMLRNTLCIIMIRLVNIRVDSYSGKIIFSCGACMLCGYEGDCASCYNGENRTPLFYVKHYNLLIF